MSTHLSDTRFSQFELPASLLSGLHEAGFEYCTPIQARTLPYTLAGKDIAGQAQTGTGKTAAFLVALYNRLLTQPPSDRRRPNQPRALILAPTRELAIQIHKDAELLGRHCGLRLGLVEGVDILIGTPGRLIDYFKQHLFDLHAIQCLVLDEADRMFDLGFIKDIRFLMRRCPPPQHRLGMLFSATLSYRVQELAYEHMNNPHSVLIESESRTADKIEECVYYPANAEKIPLLLGLIKTQNPQRSIIFVNTKRAAETIHAYLEGNGLESGVLSGDIPQKKRQSLLKRFQEGEYHILVATDVAARGLHIPEVSHVFNFDLPQLAEDYVHRIGRTARAGASGHAISFACEDSAHYLPEIEEYIGHSLGSKPVTAELLIKPAPPAKIERHRPPHHKSERSGPHRGGKPRRPFNRKPGAATTSNG